MTASTAAASRIVVGAVIHDASGLVLVARRSRPPALRGRFEFPGGKVEEGEAPVDALVREIAEELRVVFRPETEIAGGPWPIDDRHVLRLWRGSVDGDPVPGDSHDQVVWCSPADLPGVDLLDSDAAALSAVTGDPR